MKKIFITGIPTAGKTYLAEKLAQYTSGISVSIDNIRAELAHSELYKPWVNLYSDQDEATYYSTLDSNAQWKSLMDQSEHLWPGILGKIHEYNSDDRPIIFEGVNLLPHLVAQDLQFPGIALIGRSFEEVFERNKKDPRWGKTEDLQRLEAEEFFNVQRPRYKAEAEEHGLSVFETPDEAWETALQLLS